MLPLDRGRRHLPHRPDHRLRILAVGVEIPDELEPLVTGLRGSIRAIELEQRRATASLTVKQEAMSEHDLLVRACKGILSGFYLLARRPDLADRIRISLPRPQSKDDDEPSDDKPSAIPDAAPAADSGGPSATA